MIMKGMKVLPRIEEEKKAIGNARKGNTATKK